MAEKIDWNKVVEWDKKYRLHVEATNAEYVPIPIEHTEGDYLVTPDGTRLLDCLNQLICVNAGQCHPKIQEAIREATNWNRGMELPMQTFGGYEYAKEYDIERWWREINLIRLAPVTQEMALHYVGEQVLGLPRSYA